MVLIYQNPKIKLVQIEGKGRGFVSINEIEPNETILIEQPDIMIPNPKYSPLFETLYQVIQLDLLDKFMELVH